MDAPSHVPVMPEAVLGWLRIRPGGVYVDCTAGAGGHTRLIAEQLKNGRLLALDRDPTAVKRSREALAPYPFAEVFHANYADLGRVLTEAGTPHADGILLDAGLSSVQLDEPARGFSYQAEGPLDMRMDTTQPVTARNWLDSVTEPELTRILREWGDVRPARRIARAILARRSQSRLETTADLAAAIAEALGVTGRPPEETRTVFQAIRIAVNDELQSLERGVEAAVDALAPEGRLVVIAFHSGEDRIVKNTLRRAARPQRMLTPEGRVARTEPPRLRLLTPKPVQPGQEEIRRNPRAASARLRAAERLSDV